jgi:uncharacterized membrane protein
MTAQRLFLLLAIPFGLLFVVVTPPFGGGDEGHHYHRVAEVSAGFMLPTDAQLPVGIAQFHEEAAKPYRRKPWQAFTGADYRKFASIPLNAQETATMHPNIFTVHHPLNYVPQLAAVTPATWLGVRPLVLLYLARLAGLFGAIALTWRAIAVMPSHKYLFGATALLPTPAFFRSFVNADPISNAVVLLYVATVLRAMVRTTPMKPQELGVLCVLATTAVSCKVLYLPLVLLCLAIPVARFGSRARQVTAAAAIAVPAVVLSYGWIAAVKAGVFANLDYKTWGGTPSPDEQLWYVLSEPVVFAGTLGRTLFATSFIPDAIVGYLAEFGYMHIHLPPFFYGVLAVGLITVAVLDPTGQDAKYPALSKAMAVLTYLLCFGLTLLLLYVQWTGYKRNVILGFQGRYLYPIAPLLLILAGPIPQATKRLAAMTVAGLSVFGLSSGVFIVWAAYFMER